MTNDQLCQYIRNTGQVPLRFDDFDDDWCPVGAEYRDRLVADNLIGYFEGGLALTEDGLARTAEPGSPEAIAISRGTAA